MRGGYHGQKLGESLNAAHRTYIYQPEKVEWEARKLVSDSEIAVFHHADSLLTELQLRITENSVIICMSNGSFDDIPRRLREHLQSLPV